MREPIIVELESILNSVPAIKTVFRQFRQLDTISRQQYPCVMIEEDLPETSIAWKSGGFADITFEVNLLIAVMSNTAVSTAVTALDVEVKKTLAVRPTINGTCLSMKLLPESERLGSQFAPYGMSRRPLQIIYEGRATNGY